MRLLRRLAYWLRLSAHQDELSEEVAFHRAMIERDLIARGLSPEEARHAARRTMGNETSMREASRSVWVWPSLDALRQDVTVTLRDLRRNPTFTLGVVLTLALGIGANAAMFSLVDRLLFRPPAHMIDPASVHRAYLYRTSRGKEGQTGGIYARYIDIATNSKAFSQTAAFVLRPMPIGTGAETRERNVAVVSASFFSFFDAPPLLGRYFTQAEDAPPTPAPVVVISRRLWETELASRPDVLGSTIKIDAVTYTVVGIAPDDFVGLWPYQPPVAFVPVATYAANRGVPNWVTSYSTAFGIDILVRRKPDVTVSTASADLTNALRMSFLKQAVANPAAPPLSVVKPRAVAGSVLAERGPQRSSASRVATWLSGVTIVVLLIACANVVNLLLSRTMQRRREIAVRVTLGVSRARLLAHLLVEGLVLAVLGGAVGLVIAMWASNVLRTMFLPGTEAPSVIGDPRTLIFAGVVVLVIGIVTGLVPIAQLDRANLVEDLKAGAREGVRQRNGLRTAMLLLQSALSVVLLVGSGLFVRSLQNVRHVHLGFDADSVLLVGLNMRDVKMDSAALVALRLRLLESAKEVSGVSHTTLQESVPFAGMSSYPIVVPGVDSVKALGEFDVNTVSADYFKTMGTRILRGRAFAGTDVDGSQRVAVVGESMAAVLWPQRDPIGRCFKVWRDTTCTYVVGVAEDIHSESIDLDPKLFFYYLPAAQWKPQEGGLFVRARTDARQLVEPLRQRLQREMPGSAYVTVSPLAGIVDAKLKGWIIGANVFTGFGAVALLLAAVGLYSVIAYGVTQRHHELGVRLAVGAPRRSIVRLVVSSAVGFVAMGIALGTAAALALGRWVEPLLFKQSPRDPAVFALVAAVLFAAAIVASLVPALRAATVDPKVALQSD